MNLQQIDLNLLRVFDALYQLRSVSRAAEYLCISQSAFSHSLARLRVFLQDPLFVRLGQQMQPTPRAEQMSSQISDSLLLIKQALQNPRKFDPLNDREQFSLVGTDYTEYCLLPKLLCGLNGYINTANISIKLFPSQQCSPQSQMIEQALDFSLGFEHRPQTLANIEQLTLFSDSYCTIARKNHQALEHGLDLDSFLKLPHIRVSPWGEKSGVVDEVLAEQKLQRNVVLQLPSVLVAPQVVTQTDALLTMPYRMAQLMLAQQGQQAEFDIYQPPLPLPEYKIKLYWHRLNTARTSHVWFRQQVQKFLVEE